MVSEDYGQKMELFQLGKQTDESECLHPFPSSSIASILRLDLVVFNSTLILKE